VQVNIHTVYYLLYSIKPFFKSHSLLEVVQQSSNIYRVFFHTWISQFHSWMPLAYSSDSFILPLPWALNKRFFTSQFPPTEWSGSGLNLTPSPSFATCVSTPLYLTVSTVLCNLPINLLRSRSEESVAYFFVEVRGHLRHLHPGAAQRERHAGRSARHQAGATHIQFIGCLLLTFEISK
jgi:hypothetical protein